MKDFKLALCQINVTDNKEKNLKAASDMLKRAAESGADMAALPEMFNCPYDNKKFGEYAEEVGKGITSQKISELSGELGIYIVAGSIPELFRDRLYNTSMVFDPTGKMIGLHRKAHLFDINIENGIKFMESEVLSPGNNITVIETDFCRLGVAICYDIRFPELSRLMTLKGAELIILPGAFNMTTGPAHWELLMRTRALDNQVFVAAVSPARDTSSGYTAYGHSMVTSPWGSILCEADEEEKLMVVDIKSAELEKVRRELPLLKHRRTDLYSMVEIDQGI